MRMISDMNATAQAPSLLTANELARVYSDQNPTLTAEQVAKLAISSLSGEFAVRAIAVEMLTSVVSLVRRSDVLVVEKSATTRMTRTMGRIAERRDRIEALTSIGFGIKLDLTPALLSSTFTVNGEQVTWGEATVEQHEAYIEREAVRMAGIQDTIARHQAAVDIITKAGVENLNAAATV